MSSHGSHLIVPITSAQDGLRVAGCPVCLVKADLSEKPGGWIPLRCASCGTDFVASDGSPPPPPPPAPPPKPEPASPLSELPPLLPRAPWPPRLRESEWHVPYWIFLAMLAFVGGIIWVERVIKSFFGG